MSTTAILKVVAITLGTLVIAACTGAVHQPGTEDSKFIGVWTVADSNQATDTEKASADEPIPRVVIQIMKDGKVVTIYPNELGIPTELAAGTIAADGTYSDKNQESYETTTGKCIMNKAGSEIVCKSSSVIIGDEENSNRIANSDIRLRRLTGSEANLIKRAWKH